MGRGGGGSGEFFVRGAGVEAGSYTRCTPNFGQVKRCCLARNSSEKNHPSSFVSLKHSRVNNAARLTQALNKPVLFFLFFIKGKRRISV